MVSCFAMIVVPLWMFLAMNIAQICGAFSIIHQKWAWRCFYSTTEIDSTPFLWLMKVMKAWCYCWERLSTTNLSGSYVVILRMWHCYSKSNSDIQNTAVSCASGTARTRRVTMWINCGLNNHHWCQGRNSHHSSSCSSR
jgi:hypothetical protein